MPQFVASDGHSLAYRDEGAGRPLLFLHGLTASSALFAPQAAAFATSHRVIRLDLRGHGASGADPDADIARVTDDVRELIEALDLNDIIGVGWSLGAMLLWGLLDSPAAARFAGAVAIDMSPKVGNEPGWSLGLVDMSMREGEPGESWSDRSKRIAGLIVANGMADARTTLIDKMALVMSDSDPATVAALGTSMMEQDFRDVLPRITVPMLVVHGGLSRYYPAATAAWVADRLPHGRQVTFARSGHTPHLEEAEAFNRLLADFAATTPTTNDASRSEPATPHPGR
ncbi:alpha/beta hydrolase [Sphingomonas naphthae]|uniref:Alpha/beta hydrolase n=1 Tax=Sphingomonas naphthae TaxID=1813468 RepID=A0ABY7TGQ5_9SPHN|nr:alpha/beta hydrolase [Sphingomonas naphthae]WCT71996.1 alpha/beta hydrolase [Sphingomonas naphthae]